MEDTFKRFPNKSSNTALASLEEDMFSACTWTVKTKRERNYELKVFPCGDDILLPKMAETVSSSMKHIETDPSVNSELRKVLCMNSKLPDTPSQRLVC